MCMGPESTRREPAEREDSILAELAWLDAAIAGGSLSGVRLPRTSFFWAEAWRELQVPGIARASAPGPRLAAPGVAILAAALLVPQAVLVESPVMAAPAAQSVAIVRVVDAATGRPLAGARIVADHGRIVARTGADGEARISVSTMGRGPVEVAKPGYRSFPLILTGLKPGSSFFVGLSPAGHEQVARALPAPMPLQPGGKPIAVHKPAAKAPAYGHAHPAAPARPARPRTLVVKATAVPHAPNAARLSEHASPPLAPGRAKPAVVKRPGARVEHPGVKAAEHPAVRVAPGHRRSPRTVVVSRPATAITYRVRPADTLWAISGRYLGNPVLWGALYRANRELIGSDPGLIHPGLILHIPATQLARAEFPSRSVTVTVHPGDSLWSLAATHLGNGALWPRIYGINRHVISNPHWIHPGQVLAIPRS